MDVEVTHLTYVFHESDRNNVLHAGSRSIVLLVQDSEQSLCYFPISYLKNFSIATFIY